MARLFQLAGVVVTKEGNIIIDNNGDLVFAENSVYERILKFGGELDTFGHIIPFMARDTNPKNAIFGEAFNAIPSESDIHHHLIDLVAGHISEGSVAPNLVQSIDALIAALESSIRQETSEALRKQKISEFLRW